jgi:16S rRNA (cytidine1402-2'-O)-methyltransferase
VVCFESPFRLLRTLADIREVMGDVYLVVARELTKIHETFVRGGAGEVIAHFEKTGVKGEITLCFNPTFDPRRESPHDAQ